MNDSTDAPIQTITGEPVIRTVPRLADANSSGDIFGGWVLSQMDIAGAIPAISRAHGRVATVAIDAMTFHAPIFVGDHVSLYATVTKVGNTSISVRMETIARRARTGEQVRVTEGTFVYVAVDDNGKPRQVPPE
jgi:acyl-CoA thioesterase YciA